MSRDGNNARINDEKPGADFNVVNHVFLLAKLVFRDRVRLCCGYVDHECFPNPMPHQAKQGFRGDVTRLLSLSSQFYLSLCIARVSCTLLDYSIDGTFT